MPSPTVESNPAAAAQTAVNVFPLTAGVEIECNWPASCEDANDRYYSRSTFLRSVAREISNLGVRATHDPHNFMSDGLPWNRSTDWYVGEDGSCGAELRSPIFTTKEEMERQVGVVCQVLASYGSTVDNRCGLHVHLGTGQATVGGLRKFHQYLIRNEDNMFRLVPRNRRTENYCTPLTGATMQSVLTHLVLGSPHHHWGIRPWFHQSRHNTTEIRIQRGSVTASTISSWICLLQQMWLASQQSEFDPQWRMLRIINALDAPIVRGFRSRASGRAIALNMLTPGGSDTVWMQEAKRYIRDFLSANVPATPRATNAAPIS